MAGCFAFGLLMGLLMDCFTPDYFYPMGSRDVFPSHALNDYIMGRILNVDNAYIYLHLISHRDRIYTRIRGQIHLLPASRPSKRRLSLPSRIN